MSKPTKSGDFSTESSPAKKFSRTGRLSKKEEDFILQQAASLPAEAIASKLGRNVETVRELIAKKFVPEGPAGEAKATLVAARQELKQSERWKRLKEELAADELQYFEEEYGQLMSQFKGDVQPTEELQIFDAIKLSVLKSRIMVEQKRARDDRKRLETIERDFVRGKDVATMEAEDRAWYLRLREDIDKVRQFEQEHTSEFTKLQERQDQLMKTLKATRDQRIKEIESGKESFLGLVKALQQKDFQDREGRQMELMKLAAQKEYLRLGQVHTYEDGNADRPILSADTVDLETTDENS